MKNSILSFLAAISMTSCTLMSQMNDMVNQSTEAIQFNSEAIERSTEAIRLNAQLVDQSTKTIQENKRLLEAESSH